MKNNGVILFEICVVVAKVPLCCAWNEFLAETERNTLECHIENQLDNSEVNKLLLKDTIKNIYCRKDYTYNKYVYAD